MITSTKNNTKKNNTNRLKQNRKTKKSANNLVFKRVLTLDALKKLSENCKRPVKLAFMLEGETYDSNPIYYKFTGTLIKKTMNNSLTDVVKIDKKTNWLQKNKVLYTKQPAANSKSYYYLESIVNGANMDMEIYYNAGKNVLGDSMSRGLYYY